MSPRPAKRSPRMSREESREQTRDRLLQAAAHVIARKGFGATTVEDVATHAGYSRGAFYSNFRSKQELLLELLRREHAIMKADLEIAFAGAGSADEVNARLLAFYSQLYRNNDCFLLWMEAKLQAVRDARFRAGLIALLREDRERIAAIVEAYRACGFPATKASPMDLAISSMVMVDGLRFLHMIDPAKVDDTVAQRLLHRFMAVLVLGLPDA